ncbi:hypothetical protein [Streptomyces violaceoruber]|uniref:Uncharacterized protein n=1 Tax=Streptomyces violaceoruber TaxID=1935 RepID=A0ACD4WGU2_STRVN|nr:hypothetical protein R2E43_06565 [Streptomyces violaceoruber]
MNGDAEVIVLACWSDEVMDPLTRDDPERTWQGRFVPIAGHWGYAFGWWALELEKMRARKGLLRASEVAAGGRIRIQPKFYFATRTTTASGCGCSKRAGWWKSPFRAPGVSTSRHRLVRLRAEETIASSSRGELLKQLQSQQTMSAVWDVLRGQAGAPTVRQIAQATGEARGSVASALNGDLQGHRAIESVYGYLVAGRDELAHGTQKPQTLRACRESTRWFVLALVKVEEPGDLVWCPETGC